jgi:hypothetical protein
LKSKTANLLIEEDDIEDVDWVMERVRVGMDGETSNLY